MAAAEQPRSTSKVSEVCSRLTELALEKGPDARLPSVRELCQMLDTSWSTLKEALNLLEAQRVLYRKSGSGIFVASAPKHKTLCLLLNVYHNIAPGTSPFWATLWGLLGQEALQRQEHSGIPHRVFTFLGQTDDLQTLPQEFVQLVQAGQVGGVIVVSLHGRIMQWIVEQGIPVVGFAGWSPHTVGFDMVESLKIAIERLAQQGCRHLGYWTTTAEPGGSSLLQARTDEIGATEHYFRHLLPAYGITFDRTLIRCYDPAPGEATPTFQEQGYLLAQRVFGEENGPRPDGLLIMNDLMTEGALIALLSLGVHLGKDLKIASFSNVGSMLLFGYLPGMTIIETDTAKLVHTLFSVLDRVIAGEQQVPKSTFVAPQLRQQTRALLAVQR